MKVETTPLSGVLVVQPDKFGDDRGFFMETHHLARYSAQGVPAAFVQDNLSLSSRGVLRGLHFQNPNPQGKLVYVLQGEIFDVAVDVRLGSPTFGKWFGTLISAANHKQIYVPSGYAHGFAVTSDKALVAYKCTDYYAPKSECTILWDDPEIGIDWPIDNPILSDKDGGASTLGEFDQARLPRFND